MLRVGVVDDGNVALETDPKGPVAVVDGKAAWQVKSSHPKSGLVTLVLYSQDTVGVQKIKCMVVASELGEEIQQIVVADTQHPPGPTLYRGTPKQVSLRYYSGSPLQNSPVQLIANGHVGLQPTDITFIYLGNDVWSVTASQAGMFLFGATFPGMSDMSGPLCRVV